VRAVDEQVDRLARLEAELLERAPAWRLYPVVQALQALRGVQWLVAITVVAELGDLTRFDSPRQLGAFVGLIPSEYSSGPARIRLCKRFRRLVARGKHPNVAVTAIARELIAFMWAIAKEVTVTA